jgi:hypothetical protein
MLSPKECQLCDGTGTMDAGHGHNVIPQEILACADCRGTGFASEPKVTGLRRLADYHSLRIGRSPKLWSNRWPGIQIDVELRKFWRGYAWVNREDHRVAFGWGDHYADDALSVWIRYWPVSKAKSEEIPF